MTEPQIIVVTTTSDRRETLERIATELVSEELAACCQISGTVTSHYRWQGKVEQTEEWVCSIKTVAERFDEVSRLILERHHYEQPQIIAVKAAKTEPGFATWISSQVEKS